MSEPAGTLSPRPSSTSTVRDDETVRSDGGHSVSGASDNGSPKRSSKRKPVPQIEDHWTGAPQPGLIAAESQTPDNVSRPESRRSERGNGEDKEIEVGWEDDDPENPQNFTMAKKWRLTILASVLTIVVTFASSVASSTINAVVEEFGCSMEVAELLTTLFLCGYVIGPLIWAPASELVGRRPVFLVTQFLFIIFQLLGALALNLPMLLIGRFLQGLFASAPLTNCGGLIADIWSAVHRGTAMSFFSASVFLGPVIGPIIGGFVTPTYLGWRFVYYVTMIFGALVFIPTIFFLPETFAPVLLHKRAKKLRKEHPENRYTAPIEKEDTSIKALASKHLIRPFIMLGLEPILVFVTLYLSIIYGLLYALFEAFPIIWEQLRGFNGGESGLIFIGIGIGTTIGATTNIMLQRHYKELTPKWKGFPPPEQRLRGSMVAAPILIVGIFFLGWTGYKASIPWYVPAIATIVVGSSFSLVFISYLSYLVDVYLMYAASALAASTVIRSACAAAVPLFTVQMFNNLGVQWACTLIGCLGVVLLPIPFIFYRYGAKIRERSRFAPCKDLEIKKELDEEARNEKHGQQTA